MEKEPDVMEEDSNLAQPVASTSGREDASNEGFPIFFRDGNRVRRVTWKGSTWTELLEVYSTLFSIEDLTSLRRHHFCLRHREFKVLYENWSLQDLHSGAMIEVRTPDSLLRARRDNERLMTWESQRSKRAKRAASNVQPMFDTRRFVLDFMGRRYGVKRVKVHPVRYWRRRVWTFFDDSNSSTWAYMWAVFIIVVIIFSTVTFCVETLPYFPQVDSGRRDAFSIIEMVNVGIFTVEFVTRAMTAPSGRAFLAGFMNWIDFVAIAPFYIELVVNATTTGHTPTLQVFRILRLVRVFRLFRMSRAVTEVFAKTMQLSAKPLYMLVFFTCLGVVFFSSLLYYTERGVYDRDLRVWKRVAYYNCRLNITAPLDAPWTELSELPLSGLPTGDADNTPCSLEHIWEGGRVGEFICPYRFPKNKRCEHVYEVSPYESIPATFWWCIVTITTTGYGDVTPTQWYGKALAMAAMLSGILVIALPITVIGANFSAVYDEYMERVREENARAVQAAREKKLAAGGDPGGRSRSKNGTGTAATRTVTGSELQRSGEGLSLRDRKSRQQSTGAGA